MELSLKKLPATQASIQSSFPGEEEDRTENIAVEIHLFSGPINCLTKFVDAEFIFNSDVLYNYITYRYF